MVRIKHLNLFLQCILIDSLHLLSNSIDFVFLPSFLGLHIHQIDHTFPEFPNLLERVRFEYFQWVKTELFGKHNQIRIEWHLCRVFFFTGCLCILFLLKRSEQPLFGDNIKDFDEIGSELPKFPQSDVFSGEKPLGRLALFIEEREAP